MTITEARAYLKAHASIAVALYRLWTDVGLEFTTTELAESVALNIHHNRFCPPPMQGGDDLPF